MTSSVGTARSPVVSRHRSARKYPWNIEAENLNPWCRLPGSPFADGFVLVPNHPSREAVSITYGPLELPDCVDTFACLVANRAGSDNANVIAVRVAVVDDDGVIVAEETTLVSYGHRAVTTVRLVPPHPPSMRVRFQTWLDHFDPSDQYGAVRVLYLLAYADNVLVDLLNAAGSDKGTTRYSGQGVPHCYALEYHRLFQGFRDDRFALLEIGLDDATPPTDAPSLRVWREYFPNALLYGYDIEDFSFFVQRDTFAFQGDQASREDLQRFLEVSGAPPFRLVIDDGSHASSHQQISLAMLFPRLEPGGLYVVEDLSWQPFPETPTTLDVLRGFVERGTIESPFLTDAEARNLGEAIDAVTIYRPNDSDFAVIEKKTT